MTYQTIADLPWRNKDAGIQKAVIFLAKGESAPNPASTKRRLNGPSKVTYVRYPDGGIDAHEEDA